MSGGQQQRVAIARAVVGERRLILADEPTGALDTETGEEILRLLRARCDAGAAGVLVTHEARHAAWADRVVFLRDGVVVDESGADPSTRCSSRSSAGELPCSARWRPPLRMARRDALRAPGPQHPGPGDDRAAGARRHRGRRRDPTTQVDGRRGPRPPARRRRREGQRRAGRATSSRARPRQARLSAACAGRPMTAADSPQALGATGAVELRARRASRSTPTRRGGRRGHRVDLADPLDRGDLRAHLGPAARAADEVVVNGDLPPRPGRRRRARASRRTARDASSASASRPPPRLPRRGRAARRLRARRPTGDGSTPGWSRRGRRSPGTTVRALNAAARRRVARRGPRPAAGLRARRRTASTIAATTRWSR